MYNVFSDFTRSRLNIIFLCWHHEYTSVLLPAALHHEGCDRDQKVPNASSSEPVRRYVLHYSWKITSHIWLDSSLGKISCIQIWYPIVSKYNCVCHITSMTSNLSYIALYINWYKCVTIVTIVSQLYVQVPASFFTFKLHKIIPKKSTTNSPSSRCLRPRQKCSMVS